MDSDYFMEFDNEFYKKNKNDDTVRVEQAMKRIKNKLDLFKYKKQLKPVKPVKPYNLQPASYYVNSESMNIMC